MDKPRVIKDFDKLPQEVVEQIKLVYPLGFAHHLVPFVNKLGEKKKGLPFETEDHVYLVRMTEQRAVALIDEDDDYNDEGILKSRVKSAYEEKYEDEDFLHELNNNKDNDLGVDDDY